MTESKNHVFLFGPEDLQDILSQHAVQHLGLAPGSYHFALAASYLDGNFIGMRLSVRSLDNVTALVKARPLAKCGLREPELPAPENDSSQPRDDSNG